MVVASIARGGLSGEEMAKLDAVLESDGGDVDLGFLVDQWKKLRAAQQPAPAAVAAAGRVSPVSPTDIVAPDSTPMDLDLASATSAARPPMKLKLFQFSEDKRPAFYGTYRRRSAVVRGRRPFKCEANLDYEYVSPSFATLPFCARYPAQDLTNARTGTIPVRTGRKKSRATTARTLIRILRAKRSPRRWMMGLSLPTGTFPTTKVQTLNWPSEAEPQRLRPRTTMPDAQSRRNTR